MGGGRVFIYWEGLKTPEIETYDKILLRVIRWPTQIDVVAPRGQTETRSLEVEVSPCLIALRPTSRSDYIYLKESPVKIIMIGVILS